MFNPPIHMVKCKKCGTIQKVGTDCGICNKPVVHAPVYHCSRCYKPIIEGSTCSTCGTKDGD